MIVFGSNIDIECAADLLLLLAVTSRQRWLQKTGEIQNIKMQ